MTATGAAGRFHPADLVPLTVGLTALAAGTALGWQPGFVEAVVGPPALVRAVLVGGAGVVALVLLAAAIRRLDGAGAGTARASDLPRMVRGIRLVFLAIASVSAGIGWALAHPLPLVVAFVIAGVDVLETSFLLAVVALRRE